MVIAAFPMALLGIIPQAILADVAEEDFSCLFCYCPLYTLGRKCGGNWHYTEKGIKSCGDCSFPHHSGNYECVISRFEEIMAVVRKMDGTGE